MAIPDVNSFILSAWGFPSEGSGFLPTSASGLVFGTNPTYEIDDFLAVYPKFGQFSQTIAAVTVGAGGSGYQIGDTLNPVQDDSADAVVTVTGVDANGAVADAVLAYGGIGYAVADGLATQTDGSGTGATVDVTAIVPGNLLVPEVVLNLYIALASSCLIKANWGSMWEMAMGLFVAHFATLYLDSDGSPATTPGRAAQQGMAKGIMVSKSAGDVSASYESVQQQLEGFAAWNLTKYGQQLATFAKTIGNRPMLLW